MLTESAARFGSQCIVASIDARDEGEAPVRFRVYTHGGRTATDLEGVEWARRCARLGAGEILLTAIHRDGARCGFDLELTKAVVEAVGVPVIASGGAGTADHFRAAFEEGLADAALAAGILHDGVTTIGDVKRHLAAAGVAIRPLEQTA